MPWACPTLRAMVEADGSEDVSDFLFRIRELGDKRDREDEERTRKLEEEILQGRKERQARRAGGRIIWICATHKHANTFTQIAPDQYLPLKMLPPLLAHRRPFVL